MQDSLDAEVKAAEQLRRHVSAETTSAQRLREKLQSETKQSQQLQHEHQAAVTTIIDLRADLALECAHAQRLVKKLETDAELSQKVLATKETDARHLREKLEQEEHLSRQHEVRLQHALARHRERSEEFEVSSLQRDRECASLRQDKIDIRDKAAAEIAEVRAVQIKREKSVGCDV